MKDTKCFSSYIAVPELLERIRCKRKMLTNDSKAVEEAQLKSLHEVSHHPTVWRYASSLASLLKFKAVSCFNISTASRIFLFGIMFITSDRSTVKTEWMSSVCSMLGVYITNNIDTESKTNNQQWMNMFVVASMQKLVVNVHYLLLVNCTWWCTWKYVFETGRTRQINK